ncbi:S49 family peptidase [Parvularcula sp. LCG005]|uniref:S49 family peptidase n=1 Tax=Parvularcula sp. LCG005 TaxID=3078805 RepID=UPI002943502B|nr:S49 family peptidase [Parvularcula sp. LCG005]WOI52101.1 S49 family peptidase [Parvularcula sp. LCG005]
MLKKLWHKLPFTGGSKPTVAVVPLTGVLAPEGRSGRSISFDSVQKPLTSAFTTSGVQAVVISINSPGGSPAQSRMIHDRIRSLSAEHKVPVITYIEDVGASGGYMLAIAGDDVYADPFAIVGSIGVIAGGFGFTEAMHRLGIQRRVYTAGENKSQLDPFQPEDPADVARLETLLGKSHTLFIDMVQRRRGEKLTPGEETLFDGKFWIAGDAQALGLIDGTGDLREVLQARFGKDVKIRRIEIEKKSLVSKLLGLKGPLLDPQAMMTAADDHAAWARFGR